AAGGVIVEEELVEGRIQAALDGLAQLGQTGPEAGAAEQMAGPLRRPGALLVGFPGLPGLGGIHFLQRREIGFGHGAAVLQGVSAGRPGPDGGARSAPGTVAGTAQGIMIGRRQNARKKWLAPRRAPVQYRRLSRPKPTSQPRSRAALRLPQRAAARRGCT